MVLLVFDRPRFQYHSLMQKMEMLRSNFFIEIENFWWKYKKTQENFYLYKHKLAS